MSSLISISTLASRETADLSAHRISTLPIVVLSPHNQCNCRCVMCDIWRIREAREITVADLEPHLNSFRELGVRWVVFTGGEPQLNSQLFALAHMLRKEGIRITLLTAGLLLESQANELSESIDDVIVSLDGPPAVHDQIRRVPQAFQRMARGVEALHRLQPDMQISARSTVQKTNYRYLRQTVAEARQIGLNSISFLAADISSAAFNRPQGWPEVRQSQIALNAEEVSELDEEIEALIEESSGDLESGFILESAGKLRRIVLHFRACLGQVQPVAPRCNAPWVSTVIDSSGEVRPCFFHPAIGNIHRQSLPVILNGPEAVQFRGNLNVATNPICRRCVCSLHLANEQSHVPTV